MSTFNVRSGTKVPRIGNAPTHFIASALTLHQPEMHRRNRKRIRVAIHWRFRVYGDVVLRDSVEQSRDARLHHRVSGTQCGVTDSESANMSPALIRSQRSSSSPARFIEHPINGIAIAVMRAVSRRA